MIVGVPKETKRQEYRVALTPVGVRELVHHGHEVLIEAGAGIGSAIPDAEYIEQGAGIAVSAADVFQQAGLVLKVKEPLPNEVALLHEGQVLFTYLHLAAHPDLTASMSERGIVAIAYETVQSPDGSLPLLAPMSEVAGRMATQVGAFYLQKAGGGRGILLGGVAGVMPAKVVVIGAGISGINAALIAMGMQARVVVLDRDIRKLRAIDETYLGHIVTLSSNRLTIEREVLDADLVIGCVLVTGASAPKLVSEEMVRGMLPGSVLVDVAIDQGGCFQTSHETSHDDPVYALHDVIHYAVGNIPGAVPHTSTYALTNATLPYVLTLADEGVCAAVNRHHDLLGGVNLVGSRIVHRAVAGSLGLPCTDPVEALAAFGP